MSRKNFVSHRRWGNWKTKLLAERITFSSFSVDANDAWGHDIKRPYLIVRKPGTDHPADLDLRSKDSIWVNRNADLKKPFVIWDGFSAEALHEVIYECLDPAGPGPRYVVVDAKTKKVIPDIRDKELVRLRPKREHGWGPNRILEHLAELSAWMGVFEPTSPYRNIYPELFGPREDTETDSVDSYWRREHLIKGGFHRSHEGPQEKAELKDQLLMAAEKGKLSPCGLTQIMSPKSLIHFGREVGMNEEDRKRDEAYTPKKVKATRTGKKPYRLDPKHLHRLPEFGGSFRALFGSLSADD